MKNILFVDDEINVLNGLRRALHAQCREWAMTFCESPREALQRMEAGESFEVVVSDMQMPEMHGTEFLCKVMEICPMSVRIALSGHTDAGNLMRSNVVAHQFLSKPADPRKLVVLIKRACVLRDRLTSAALSQKLLKIGGVPSVPDVYRHILEEVRAEDPAVNRVAAWIEKDAGLAAKVLQLVNSAFMGLKRHVTDIPQACALLGLDHLKALVLMAEIFSVAEHSKLRQYLNLDALWNHCMRVAELARRIAEDICDDEKRYSDAYTAGLLHEIGQIVLAQKLPDEFAQAFEYAQEKRIPLVRAEKELFGSTHAAIGGYLLELWGLPDPVVEAILYYDYPSGLPEELYETGEEDEHLALTSLHAAVYFAASGQQGMGSIAAIDLDTEYLERVRKVDRVDAWYDLCAE